MTIKARTTFRARFATADDYRLYMRGLALRPRRRKAETHAEVAARRGKSISTIRRYRAIESHSDLVEAVNAGRMSRAAAGREARLRALPYVEQLAARQSTLTPEEAADTIRAIVRGEVDLASVMLALVPDPESGGVAEYMLLGDALKRLRDR